MQAFWKKHVTSPLRSAFKNPRSSIIRILNLMMIVCMALMLWKGMILYTGSESPVVVVLSGSMEPTFFKGDILTLSIPNEPYKIGDIVVFKIPGREIPIVHRVLEIHNYIDQDKKMTQKILTKGDNNDSFDRPLYMGGTWITPDQILGKARIILPSLGHVTILLTEYPYVKYALLTIMAIFVLTAKE